MSSPRTGWRIAFHSIRDDFKRVSDVGASLRHMTIQSLSGDDSIPPSFRRRLDQPVAQRIGLMSPPWDHDARKHGFLSGPTGELERFTVLAERAWLALPGTIEGKLQAYPQMAEVDRWLSFVYRQLRDSLPHYLSADRLLWACWPAGPGGMQELGFPYVRACGVPAEGAAAQGAPVAESYPDADAIPPAAARWLIDELAVDVFTASVLAIEQLLAHPDPEGPYLVSWREMAAFQESSAFQNANWYVDGITLGGDRSFPIYRNSCKPVPGAIPSICPFADPPRDEEDRAALREFLPQIEQRFRGLRLVKDRQTIHWVGHQASLGSLCRCDLSGPVQPSVPALRQDEAERSDGDRQGKVVPDLPEWVGEHFQRNQYKLLRLLWNAGEVAIAAVHREIYEERSGKEEALDKVKDRVNSRLAEISQPYEIVTRRSEVYVLRRVA